MGECQKCNLGLLATEPLMLGKGVENAKIMLIADAPTVSENDAGIVFGSKAARNLIKALDNRGIPKSKLYCTYALKCPALEEKKISQKQITACKDYLMTEISIVKPEILVPLGNAALKMVFNKTDITKRRGKAFKVDDKIILPILHPSTLKKTPGNKELIQKDLDTLKDIYENGMPKVSNTGYKVIDNKNDAISEIDRLEKECLSGDPELEWLSFDIESTGNNPFADNAKTICISLSNKERTGIIIPLYHHESTITGQDLEEVIERLKKLLENKDILKTAYNGKFDIMYMHIDLGIYVENFAFDPMLGHYLAISEIRGTQGLKAGAWEFTDMGGYDNDLDKYKETLPEADRNNYDNIPWSILSPYGAADADCCLRLLHIYKPLIDANPKWKRIMNEIYIPASYALLQVEEWGMHLNTEVAEMYLEKYTEEFKRIINNLNNYPEVVQIEREKRELYAKRQALLKSVPPKQRTEEQKSFISKTQKYKDFTFNWGSPKQLGELFYGKLGLKTSIRTDSGELSTSNEALEEIAEQHPIANDLSEYRKISILINMFISKIPHMKDKNGILHPSFLLSGTETSRLASVDPNVQQLPRHAENPTLFQYKYEPKSLFDSRYGDDGCIMNLDYSQLELRIAAIISGDKNFIAAYNSGADVHKLTASKAWSVPVEDVTGDMRTAAKSVSFGVIYGKGPQKLGLEIYTKAPYFYDEEKAKKEGEKLQQSYFKAYPSLKKWLDNSIKNAQKYGYVETMFGFRRRLPNIHSKVPGIKANAERQAMNSPIQGTGSYCTLISIIKIVKYLKETNKKTRLVCTVHDSIVFDVYIPELPTVAKKCKEIMEAAFEGFINIPIPLLAEIELGKEYGSVRGVELEDIKDIDTAEKFKVWWDNQILEKHKDAEKYMKKKLKFTEEQIENYKKENNWI